MKDIHLSSEKNKDEYKEWQNAIKDDFKRITYILEDYVESSEKQVLLSYINNLIFSIQHFKFINKLPLQFKLTDKYAIFSYYDYDENLQPLFDVPTVVILKRNLKEIFFITELYNESINYESENYLESFINYSFIYFNLDNNEVKLKEFDLPTYSSEMFDNAFTNTEDHIYLIKYLMNKKTRK